MVKGQETDQKINWLLLGGIILFFPVLAVFASFIIKKDRDQDSFSAKYGVQDVRFEGRETPVSEELADALFPEEKWDPLVLAMFERGPTLLATDMDFKVAPPPENTSKVTEAGLDLLRSYARKLRTPEQLALIHAENEMTRMYEPFEKAGIFLSAENKETVDLIDMAQSDLGYFIVKYKKAFMRARPNVLAPDLETVIENPGHPAYPSGHGSQGHMTALVLSLLDPAHEAQYKALGHDIGLRREIAGIHYPSDAIAGRKLAQAVLDKLLEVPAFKEQLEKARKSFTPVGEDSFKSFVPVDTSAASEP